MEDEWDETKRQSNIAKHGIDFVAAVKVFDGWCLEFEDRRRDYGESRFIVSGQLNGQVLRVVYTKRGNRRRIISARRARRDERTAYYAGLAQAACEDEGPN
jgi:hypothetical protein